MGGLTGNGGLDESACLGCASPLAAAARFCPRCGLAVARAPFGRGAVLGAVAFALLSGVVVAGWSAVWTGDLDGLYGAESARDNGVPEATLEIAAADVRKAADELFNQVVDAAGAGDTVQLRAFLPMAVMAYLEAGPLDADGIFHLATLQRIGDAPEESLASALALLDRDPDHLLGLGAAAEASLDLGRRRDAARYYERFTDVFETQADRPLGEYLGHAALLERMKRDSDAFLRAGQR
jgi:hypothetical protein